jgi:hypothetical protein
MNAEINAEHYDGNYCGIHVAGPSIPADPKTLTWATMSTPRDQFKLTPEQCRQLAGLLLVVAEACERANK